MESCDTIHPCILIGSCPACGKVIVNRFPAPGLQPADLGALTALSGFTCGTYDFDATSRLAEFSREWLLFRARELETTTLWDLSRQYVAQGLPGIPRTMLLGHLMDAARIVDHFQTKHLLKGLDLKPQSLVLSMELGVRLLLGYDPDDQTPGNASNGVTPVYAAPETFVEGRVSWRTDQYALAIVYQEMLTGKRPFRGTTVHQLVMQHLNGEPDLSPLPEGDRPIVARALAKEPEERFPSCSDFVQALVDS